ncbi:MAG TPA: hypothetical protein VEF53_03295 [Patescibacteria group bacterium]|nr:hypothetical protein [Patescibacteria group bacterium]
MNHRIQKHTFITLAAILIIIGCFAFFFSIVTTTGHIVIQDKEVIDGKYYIYFDNNYNNRTNITQIECIKEEYDKVVLYEKSTCEISYKSSILFPDKGKLIYLNFNNTANNE